MKNDTAENKQRTQGCATRLLPDVPAQDDAFGSHKRTADALAGMIVSETGGKAIALEGPYGSGKSTVVNLLVSALEAESDGRQPQNHVVVFDAWAHQGDPLRRSFLEELVRSLHKQGWTKAEKWRRDLEKLSRRLEESDTTSTPSLTGFGALLAASLFVLPVGYVLLGKYGTDLTVRLPIIATLPIWIVGLLLLFVPFVIAILIWLCLRPTINPITKRFWKQHRTPYEDESIGSLFMRRTKEVNRSTTLRTPDPTSIEFRDIFVRILNDALTDDRRLLIVVDNLDRIPSREDALTVWSTMRAFFDPSGNASYSWMDRFWLLVPFDFNAMAELWSSEERHETELGKSLLDKTFQITFRVPPPVLTTWKDFMMDRLAEAFPDHSTNVDFGVIYRLYRRHVPEGKPLTPRSIILFINSLGALHRQWGDSIPLPAQSLYALYDEDIAQDPEAKLRDGKFFEQGSLDSLEQGEWQRYLAALHYNVDPDVAIQVLIGTSVEKSLLFGSPEGLEEFQNVPGFVEVCERIVEDSYRGWVAEEPASLAKAALAIHGIEEESKSVWGQTWHWLCRGASQVDVWSGLDEYVGKGLVSLLEHSPTTEEEKLSERILKGLCGTVEENGDPSEIHTQWLSGALQVVEYLRREQGSLLEEHFRVPGTPAYYLRVMRTLFEMRISQDTCSYFSPSCTIASIEEEIVRRVEEDELDDSDTEAIRFLRNLNSDEGHSWHGLQEAFQQKLQSGPNLDTTQVATCGKGLLWLAYDGEVPDSESVMENLCSQGYITSHLYDVQTAGDFEATAVCLLFLLDFYPEAALQSATMNAQPGQNNYDAIKSDPQSHNEIVESLAHLIWHFNRLQAMFETARETSSVKALVLAIVRVLADREDAYLQFTPSLLIRQYRLLSEGLSDESSNALIGQLLEYSDLLDVLMNHEFTLDLVELYSTTLQAAEGQVDFERFADYLTEGIQEVTKDQWSAALDTESELLELVVYLNKNGRNLDLTRNFHSALLEHAQKVKSEQRSIGLQKDWKHVSGALNTEWRETFFRDFRDFLIVNADEELSSVIALYGDSLLESQIISEPGRVDDVVRKLFTRIVEQGSSSELEWMASALDTHPEVLERCPEASREVLRDRVHDALTNPSIEEHVVPLKRMGKVLKVRARRKKDDS